ncbi:outer membrane protein [Oricola indica]|uniref:outer membrane protein n=1 Tax=Oricola indica TaxID=2872591 RepID=UPI003CCBBE5F
MKKYLTCTAATVGLLFSSAGLAAAADEIGYPSYGLYASLHGGWYLPQEPTATFEVGPDTVLGGINVDNGYRIGGAIGYDLTRNFAVEFETSFARANVNSIDVGPPVDATQPAPGYGTLLTLMGNAIVGEDYGKWRPYVGAGIGGALVSLNVDFMSGLDDSDWALAGQVFAGIDYAISDNVSVGARYRYQHVGSTSYTDDGGDAVGLSDFGAHSIEFGLKVKFGS